MYLDAEYGESAPLQLMSAVLLYGSEQKIRLATIHQPMRDPQGGPALLDAGEPLTREFLDKMTRGLGSELPATFLPSNVLIYSAQTHRVVGATTDPQYVFCARLRWQDTGWKTLSSSGVGVRGAQRPTQGLGSGLKAQRPEPDTWLYMAPYWNTYEDGRVCHGTMQTPQTVTIENLPQWSQAFFASEFTGSNLGIQQCSHPEGFLGMWASLAGAKRFPPQYLLRKGRLEATLCRSR